MDENPYRAPIEQGTDRVPQERVADRARRVIVASASALSMAWVVGDVLVVKLWLWRSPWKGVVHLLAMVGSGLLAFAFSMQLSMWLRHNRPKAQ